MDGEGNSIVLYRGLGNLLFIQALGGVVVVAWALVCWIKYYRSWVDLPVVGPKGFLATRRSGSKWPANSDELLQEGYVKYGDGAFQVRTQGRWTVCICDDEMVREYQSLPDDIASLDAVSSDLFQTKYTCPGVADSLKHLPVAVLSKAVIWSRARTSGTTSTYFQELVREQEFGLKAEIKVSPHEWTDYHCLPVALALMLRMIGRVLVGSPLCRDPEAVSLFTRYGSAVPVSGRQIAWLPEVLKPLLGPRFAASRMQVELSNLIVNDMTRNGDAKDDQLTLAQWMWRWVQREAPGEYTQTDVAGLLVSSIFGSVHTAGTVLTNTLYELSIRPEYVELLREEVDQANRDHGEMSRSVIESMTKLDSFVKETMRLNPIGEAGLNRVIKKDYTFKNGVKLPKGTFVFAPNTQLHMDPIIYEKPLEFDGLRFHKLGQVCGKPNNYKLSGASPKTRQFGDGRHTCPGKQLAADLLRLILANVLLNFDIRQCGDPSHPPLWERQMSLKERTARTHTFEK